MSKKLFVGNLNFKSTSEDVQKAFEQYGTVSEAKVIEDRDTQRSRGFAFVTMDNDADADKAIAGLNNQDFMGRMLKVNEARERESRPRRDQY